MVMNPGAVLREIERHRRYLAPRRAMRRAYAPVVQAFGRLAPRVFELGGETRCLAVVGDPAIVEIRLKEHVVFTLDSALEHSGLGRWSTDRDLWAYVDGWPSLEALAADGLLVGPDAAPGEGGRPVLLRCCHAAEPPPEVRAASGFRVVQSRRLAEDLLGRYGLRLDLFARLMGLAATLGGVQVLGSSRRVG